MNSHNDYSYPGIVLLSMVIYFFAICIPQSSYADVVTDGSVGPAQSLSGPNYLIPDTLGTTAGTNLFHSFQNFSITQNQSATFTGPDTIANVISRVTGGEVSSIDGLLRSEVGQANFFFINPSGIVFGPNAVVDVPAAFHVSTADELRFDDGSVFSALSSDTSTLTQAAPESFGFLGTQAASIEVNGALLEFKPGSKVSLSSGDITIQGTDAQDAELVSQGGEIRLTAMGNEMGVVPIYNNPSLLAQSGLIKIELARISTSGNPAGAIFITTEDLNLNQAAIRSTASDGDGGGIIINASGLLSINTDSDITANNLGAGNGPNIEIKARDVIVNDGSWVDSRTVGTGPAGGILFDVEEKILVNGVGPSSYASSILSGIVGNANETGSLVLKASELQITEGGSIIAGNTGPGHGADLFIDVDSLTISDGGNIGSVNSGTGSGGEISISLTGDMTMTGGKDTVIVSQIGSGQGGDINISAGGTIKMDGGSVISIASLNSDSGIGADLIINADKIELNGGSQIYANCDSGTSGQVGDISIKADQSVSFKSHNDSTFSGIYSQLHGGGGVGRIEIETPMLTIEQGAKIQAQNYSTVKGKSGSDIVIRVDDLTIISDNSSDPFGSSEIVSSAAVDSFTAGSGAGNGGLISIEAQNLITIDGNNNMWGAAIRNSGKYGNGGDLQITAGGLEIFNNGQISSTTESGTAGDITINVDTLDFKGGQISNSVVGAGTAGTIHIEAADSINIEGSEESSLIFAQISQIDSLTLGKAQAGNIFINTPLLYVGQGGRIVTTTHGKGAGGTIAINSSQFIIQDGAYISSSAWAGSQGNAGSVIVNAKNLSINGESTGIYSSANNTATGYVGDVIINADSMALINGGEISISADQTLSDASLAAMPQNSITINTNTLNLDQDSKITAESSANVPAGAINIQANKTIIENSSSITTTSNDADGGPITIQSNSIFLNDGLITTSVAGTTGNGGDITISGISNDNTDTPADALILKGGFIQANTGATQASGGNININVSAVIVDASGELQIGGEEHMEFQPGQKINIIQAAAPGGEQGTINITAPAVDISSSIINTGAYFANPAQLATDPCFAVSGNEASSLVQGGRGGIPQGPEDPSTISFIGERLDWLLNEEN